MLFFLMLARGIKVHERRFHRTDGNRGSFLELFLKQPGRVLSRDEISNMLRGHEWSPLDPLIDGHVSRLRRKIDIPGKEEPSFIKSVRGVGYVFAGEVSIFSCVALKDLCSEVEAPE